MNEETRLDFVETLCGMRNGTTVTLCAEKLAEVLDAVGETGRPGELVLKIKAEVARVARSGEVSEVTLTHEIKAKVPEHPPGSTLFFLAKGVLSRVDPNQMAFDMTMEREEKQDGE